jgi:cytochrome-b5 reductase
LVEKDENDQFPLKVIRKDQLNHDSYLYVLEFPNADWISGLFPGGHFYFHAEVDGKMMSKRYTPISPVNEKGQA